MDENQKVFLRLKNDIKHGKNYIDLNNKTYTFERVFKGTQKDTFNIVARELTEDFIRGFNATLLAYGQTGSGKTYTIQGTMHDNGIIQRALNSVFNGKMEDDEIFISYIEIYNESLFDLFCNNEKVQQNIVFNLCIREDPEKGIFVENIALKNPKKYEEALDIFYDAIKRRRTAETKMNIESSRSHAIFTIYIENSDKKGKISGLKKRSKFHIVDLAGSERVDRRYSDERIKESGGINKSLLCLSSVIEKLSNSENHVNYRDSKLTYLLKDCLGGNSKLAVIGNINYEENNIENLKENTENCTLIKDEKIKPRKRIKNVNFYETINTLNFLLRVKAIKNTPIANTEFNGDLDALKKELKELHLKYEKMRLQNLNNISDENQTQNSIEKPKKPIIYDVMSKKCKLFKKKIVNIQTDLKLVHSKISEVLENSLIIQNKEFSRISKIYNDLVKERNKQLSSILEETNKTLSNKNEKI